MTNPTAKLPEKIVAWLDGPSRVSGKWIADNCTYDLGDTENAVYVRRDMCTEEAAKMSTEFDGFRKAAIAKVERLERESKEAAAKLEAAEKMAEALEKIAYLDEAGSPAQKTAEQALEEYRRACGVEGA